MKKKIYVFLVVLASVIACTVCLAACNGGSHPAEYVGNYECVSQTVISKEEGGSREETMILTKAEAVISELELKADGSFNLKTGMYGGRVSQTGTWTVSGGQLNLTVSTGTGISSGTSRFACSLTDGTLILKYEEAYAGLGSAKIEIELKKVAEDNPAE